MAVPISGAISLAKIRNEFEQDNYAHSLYGFTTGPTSLAAVWAGTYGAINTAASDPGGTLYSSKTAAPHRVGEILGYNHDFSSAITYINSFSSESASSDSNTSCGIQLRVQYLNGNIEVKFYGSGDSDSQSDNTLLYRITNPPAGYTVRHNEVSLTDAASGSDENPYYSGSSIGYDGSAVSIPASTSFVDFDANLDSGGDFEDPGTSDWNFSSQLIFEKSGSTTYTYSFTFSLTAENSGEGGE